MAKHIPAWRKLELIVADIEEYLSARGVDVKCPDHIECLRTNQLRQVDVALRFKGVSSAKEFLVIVECRNRGRPAGPDWVQYLAQLREDLGAQLVIAVSKSGFTLGAKEAARSHRVELRRICDISRKDMDEWVAETGPHFRVRMMAPYIKYLGMQFTFFTAEGRSILLSRDHFATGNLDNLEAPIARNKEGQAVSLGVLIRDFLGRDKAAEAYMQEPDGRPFVYTFRASFLPGFLFVKTDDGEEEANGMELHARLLKGHKEIPVTVDQRIEYADETGALAWHNTVTGYHEELERGITITYLEKRLEEQQ